MSGGSLSYMILKGVQLDNVITPERKKFQKKKGKQLHSKNAFGQGCWSMKCLEFYTVIYDPYLTLLKPSPSSLPLL